MRCVTRVIKLFLCILILFCGAVIGLHLSQRLNRRRDILQSFDALFHRAAIRITYNAGSLCEVFSENFAAYKFDYDQPFDEQWARFVGLFASVLSKEDIAMLMDFSSGLGTADADSQQRHIALYRNLLNEHIRDAQEAILTKSKMMRLLPLSAGIIVSLMLI